MGYKEKDIMHETEHAWVLRERGQYTVYRITGTHSASDSAYAPTPDGLSIAVARADYITVLAKVR